MYSMQCIRVVQCVLEERVYLGCISNHSWMLIEKLLWDDENCQIRAVCKVLRTSKRFQTGFKEAYQPQKVCKCLVWRWTGS